MYFLPFQAEKDYSALQSSNVNKAYTTLLKPLSRGIYMLELHGVLVEESNTQMDADFLTEVMEINEALADAESIEDIRQIGETNTKVLNEFILQTSSAFKEKNMGLAKELLCKLKYYANIDEKVKFYEMADVDAETK